MKLKYILAASLMLAIIAIGAVGATDDVDNLTLSDDTVNMVSQADEIDVVAADDCGGDEIEQEDTSDDDSNIIASGNETYKDFKANFTKTLNMDDENYKKVTLVSIYVPNNQNLTYLEVLVNGGWTTILPIGDYRGKNVNLTYENLTTKDWNFFKIGDNNILFKTQTEYSQVSVAEGNIFINKTLTKDDFGIYYQKEQWFKEDTIFSCLPPIDGNFTVYLDGKKYYFGNYVAGSYFYLYFEMFNITKDGNYNIRVIFEGAECGLIELIDSNFTYYFNDKHIKLRYGAVHMAAEFMEVDDWEGRINSTLIVRINDEVVFSKNYVDASYVEEYLTFKNFNFTTPFTYYKVNVTYIKNNTVYSTQRMLYTYQDPDIYVPKAMSVGEKDAVILRTQKDLKGVLNVYTVKQVLDECGDSSEIKDKLVGTAEIIDGFARVSLESLPEGEQYIIMDYKLGDFESWEHSYTIIVKNNTAGFKSTISATTITEGEDVTITLTGINASNKRANLYVDGVKYSEMSFNLAEVMATVEGLSVGQHYITIKHRVYAQEVYHSNTFIVTVKEKVTPQPKPPVADKIVLKLNKVKIKKSAKKLVISATLKINNKVKKGLWVVFKFNGKKYTAKTNKKGVAKITVKKNVLKKLKVGKKVTYQASYAKTVKKVSVKVKK